MKRHWDCSKILVWGVPGVVSLFVKREIIKIFYLSRVDIIDLICIIKTRESIDDKGKLSERIGRKDTGLRPLRVMIAGLPKKLDYVTHTFSGMSFFYWEKMLLLTWAEMTRLREAGMQRTRRCGVTYTKAYLYLSIIWEGSCHDQ